MAAGSYDGRATVVRGAVALVVANGTDGCHVLHYLGSCQAFDYRSLWSTTLQTQLGAYLGQVRPLHPATVCPLPSSSRRLKAGTLAYEPPSTFIAAVLGSP